MSHSRTRIVHVVDAGLTWDERLGLEQLLDRLAEERFAQRVVCLGPARGEVRRLPGAIKSVAVRFGLNFTAGPALRKVVLDDGAGVVHAWGPRAASAVCTTSLGDCATVVSLADPSRAETCAGYLRAMPPGRRAAVACATEVVRRRVVERGAPVDQAVLVRPAVNFAAIAQAKKSDWREQLGIPPEGVMLLADQPATRDGGQFCAFWAAAVRSFLEPAVRIVIPGESAEVDRLRRLARGLGMEHLLITPGAALRHEELLAVADVLLMPSAREASVTAVAWAMGAGVPVVAAATRATAELLAHEHNAFLIKPSVTKRLALRFAEAIGRRQAWSKLKETARGQAYEVFGLRRYLDQFVQTYDNLTAGRPAAEGVNDPALV